jgi:3-phenylpropionate/trans-cinnamate dioxygenase ferredoxin component
LIRSIYSDEGGSVPNWVEACGVNDVDEDDVVPFQSDGRDYAIFKSLDGEFFASDGHCTHESQLLCDGLVMDGIIECPRHNGRFAINTGKALGAPVLTDLKMYPVKTDGERVYIDLDG